MRWLIRPCRASSDAAEYHDLVLAGGAGLCDPRDCSRSSHRPQDPRAGEAAMRRDVAARRFGQTAARLRRYMMIRTWMSVATGVMVWALAIIVRTCSSRRNGASSPSRSTTFRSSARSSRPCFRRFYALAQFESLQAALVVFACLNVIQFVIGSYIEPRVSGNALAISPFIVLFSVFFWTWMWGLFGAFIGVPITIAIADLLRAASCHALGRRLAGRSRRRSDSGEIRLDPCNVDTLRFCEHELAGSIDAERMNVEIGGAVVPAFHHRRRCRHDAQHRRSGRSSRYVGGRASPRSGGCAAAIDARTTFR